MHDPWIDRLSEYLDGELPPEEAGALEQHLEHCPDCRLALHEVHQVVTFAAQLQDSPPASDLWNGIARRIAPAAPAHVIPLEPRRQHRLRISFTLPQLAAAAALVMAVAAGGMWLALQPATPVAQVAESPVPQATPSPNVLASADYQAYDSAITDLERTLRQNRGALDTATVRVVENSLASIDAAIADARAALARNPSNAFLHRHLDGAMKKKVDILRRAVSVRRAAS